MLYFLAGEDSRDPQEGWVVPRDWHQNVYLGASSAQALAN